MTRGHLYRFLPHGVTLSCAIAFLLAFTPSLSRAEDTEQPLSPPSTASKILRSLGLQNPPGKRGDKAYHRKDYEEAIRQYGKAMDETTPSAPEAPLLNRNLGNALYRQKRYAEANDYYESALKGFEARAAQGSRRDSGLASRTHHNLGNVFYRKAESADSTETQQAIADARSALEHYKKALRLDPANRATKQNLEMANAQLKKLLERQASQPKQQQKKQPQKGKQPDKKDSKDGKNKKGNKDGQNKQDDPNRKSKDGKKGDKQGQKEQKNPDKPQSPKPGEESKDAKDGKGNKDGEASKGSKMSEDEAKRLLNSFADDEKKEQAERRQVKRSRAGTEQDW